MKTPREILFTRHSQAEPKLDVVRQRALATLRASGGAEAIAPGREEGGWLGAVLRKAWLELIWPSRRAWAGLATLWIAVLAINLHMRATSPAVKVARSAPAGDLARAVEEQRRLLAELLPQSEPSAVQAPRPSGRPRSERPTTSKAV